MIKTLGLTQQEVADRFGIDRSLISILCKDKQNISNLMLYALSKEFGVNPTWLLTGEGEMFLPGRDPRNVEKSRKPNGIQVIEGSVEEYPHITTIEQIYRTKWYHSLPNEAQYVVNAIDELRDKEALLALKKLAVAGIQKQRAEEEIRRINESIDDEEKVQKKGQAG